MWNDDCENAFATLQKHLTEASISLYPDFSKPFKLNTNTGDTSIGAVLSQSQVYGGKERVVCYGSRSLGILIESIVSQEKNCCPYSTLCGVTVTPC